MHIAGVWIVCVHAWVSACLRASMAAASLFILIFSTFKHPSKHAPRWDGPQLMAEEAGLRVDKEGFEAHMAAQRERSRAAGRGAGAAGLKFEAEATAHLQKQGVARTDDSHK